jgi:hypothetical protein
MAFKKKVYECDLCGEEFDDTFIKYVSEYKVARIIRHRSIDVRLNLLFDVIEPTNNYILDLCPKCVLKELRLIFLDIREEFLTINGFEQFMLFADEVEKKYGI